jgi:hypothetical protein
MPRSRSIRVTASHTEAPHLAAHLPLIDLTDQLSRPYNAKV